MSISTSVSPLEFHRFSEWVYKHLKPEADLLQLGDYLKEIKRGYSDMYYSGLKEYAESPKDNKAWEYINSAIDWESLKVEGQEVELFRNSIAEARTELQTIQYNIDESKKHHIIKPREAKALGTELLDVQIYSIRVDSEAKKLLDLKLELIPIDKILEPEQPMRYTTDIQYEDFDKSIKNDGIIQPISIFPKGDKYEIIYGHRRFLAAKEAGEKEIRCLVRVGLSNLDVRKMRLTENIHHKDLAQMELYQDILELKRDYPDITNKELCKIIDKPEPWLTKAGSVYNDPQFCHDVRTKALDMETAYEIVHQKKELPPVMIRGIAEKVKNNDLSLKQTRQLISQTKGELKRKQRGKYCYVCGKRIQFKPNSDFTKYYPDGAHSHIVCDDHCNAAKCYHSNRSDGFRSEQSSNDDSRTLDDDIR